jgi:hypothetical protein
MRILRFIATAALISAFAVGCTKRVSQFSSVPNLGVVDFSDRTTRHFSFGGGTNCIISGVTNYHAFHMTSYHVLGETNYEGFLVYVDFQVTNADKTVQNEDTTWMPVTPGHCVVFSTPHFSVQFTPEFKTP